MNCTKLSYVSLGSGLTETGEYAFKGCTSLETVIIANGLRTISYNTFDGCTALKSIRLPSSVTKIQSQAFKGCTALATINLGKNITDLCGFENTAYYKNSSNWEDNVLYIGNYLIAAKAYHPSDYVVKDGTTVIARTAFLNRTGLKSITLPVSLKYVNFNAFGGCTSLNDVYYDATQAQWNAITVDKSDGKNAPLLNATLHLHTHSYTEEVVEPTCTEKGYTVYTCSCGYSYTGDYTDTIAHNYVNGVCTACGDSIADKHYTITVDGVTYTFDGGTLTVSGSGICTSAWKNMVANSAVTDVKICSGITEIQSEAFYECSALESVTVEDGLRVINQKAFYGCNNLRHISLPNSLKNIGNYAFSKSGLTSVVIPGSIVTMGYRVFEDCYDLKSVVVENGVERIPAFAFNNCDSITSVILPDSLTVIQDYAFSGCKSLKTITIPKNVVKLVYGAFGSCTSLESIVLPASLNVVGQSAFGGCKSLIDVYYAGNETQWKKISIHSNGNNDLKEANIHYNSNGYPFKDVNVNGSHAPFATAILWASNTGITTGYSGGLFKPDQGCTRAQVVTFLWRAAGSPEPTSYSNPFTDVSGSGAMAPYYKAILWAVEKGITSGYPDGTFRPNAVCTRAQFVTFLWRFEGQPAVSSSNPFVDVSSDSPFYTAILWAAESGVTTGYPDGTFRPNSTCTRAHVVTFIYRAIA